MYSFKIKCTVIAISLGMDFFHFAIDLCMHLQNFNSDTAQCTEMQERMEFNQFTLQLPITISDNKQSNGCSNTFPAAQNSQ